MKVTSILTIMDKPKHRQIALERALAIRAATDARMELVSFCWQSFDDVDDLLDAESRRAVKSTVIAERKAWQLETLKAKRAATAGINFRTVWVRDIAEWVARRCSESACDLIVKSVQYSKTLLHAPLDWQLLREATVPVLLASTKKRKRSGTVLAALDLRSHDRVHTRLNRVVLDAAVSYARATGAEVHCVYVIEISQVLRDLDAIDPAAVKRRALERCKAPLEELLAPYGIPKARVHLPIGKVGHTVADTARKLNADLLIVGTAAHRAKRLMGLGNSAERVLARAPCDVLAVHPD
jgi:universal stress protein E